MGVGGREEEGNRERDLDSLADNKCFQVPGSIPWVTTTSDLNYPRCRVAGWGQGWKGGSSSIIRISRPSQPRSFRAGPQHLSRQEEGCIQKGRPGTKAWVKVGALLHNLLALINLTSLGLGLSEPHCRRYGGSGNCGVQLAHSHGAGLNSIHYNLH